MFELKYFLYNFKSYTKMDYSPEFWIINLIYLIPIFFINLIIFLFVTLSSFLNKSSNLYIIKYLTLQDFIFCFFGIFQSAINLKYDGIYLNNDGCIIESTYTLFFILSTSYTLSLYTHQLDLKTKGKSLQTPKIWKILCIIWLCSAIISTFNVLSTKLTVNDCIFIFGSKYTIFFYLAGILCTSTIIIYYYLKIYFCFKVIEESEANIALYSLIIYCISILPFIISCIMQIFEYVQPIYSIISIFFVGINSVYNPVILFLNKDFRDIMLHHFNSFFRSNKIMNYSHPLMKDKNNDEIKENKEIKIKLDLTSETTTLTFLSPLTSGVYNSWIVSK
jgi:hypothetical protein